MIHQQYILLSVYCCHRNNCLEWQKPIYCPEEIDIQLKISQSNPENKIIKIASVSYISS